MAGGGQVVTVLGSTARSRIARAGLPGMLGDHVRQTRSANSPPVTAPTSHCPDCGAPQLGDLLLEESGHPDEEGKTENPRPGGTSVQHTDAAGWTTFLSLGFSSSALHPLTPHRFLLSVHTLSASLPVFVLFSFFLFLPRPPSLSPCYSIIF